jgi:hypothetical protein
MRGAHTNNRLQGKICITCCTVGKLLERNKFRDTGVTVTYREVHEVAYLRHSANCVTISISVALEH